MPQVHHAAAERQQRRVDVARLLDAVAGALRLRVALGARQVAERQPAKTTHGPSADVRAERERRRQRDFFVPNDDDIFVFDTRYSHCKSLCTS